MALRHTGPAIGAAGLILAGTFASLTLAGNTITPNLPFHLTAVGGAASGEGDLTGTCTKM